VERESRAKGGEWKEHLIEDGHSIEFTFLVDLDNDGQAHEVLPQWGGHQMKDPLARFEVRNGAFVKHVISPRSYGHGIGVGDLNGDHTVTTGQPVEAGGPSATGASRAGVGKLPGPAKDQREPFAQGQGR
jgi:hypothetical protein